MPSYGTLGALIDDGYTVSAYCACRPGRRLLDLDALAARLGRDHSCLYPDLAPRLACADCGARPEAFTVAPPSKR